MEASSQKQKLDFNEKLANANGKNNTSLKVSLIFITLRIMIDYHLQNFRRFGKFLSNLNLVNFGLANPTRILRCEFLSNLMFGSNVSCHQF